MLKLKGAREEEEIEGMHRVEMEDDRKVVVYERRNSRKETNVNF